MRVLITGATGFVGRNLLNKIVDKNLNHEILLPCRDSSKIHYPIRNWKGIETCSARDWDRIAEFEPEVIIHLAAYSTSSNDVEVIDTLIDSNIKYGVMLLDSLKNCDSLRLFVNTGSFAEYRHGPQRIDNAYLYTATKTAFRAFVDYYAELIGFHYLTAVPYSVYGGISKVKRIFDYMLEAMDSETPVGMTAGEQRLDFIHVDDVVRFYIDVIENPEKYRNLPQAAEIHLGTGRGYTLREVAQEMERISGHKLNIEWGARPYRERDTMYAVAPISSNHGVWKADITLSQGITQYLSKLV